MTSFRAATNHFSCCLNEAVQILASSNSLNEFKPQTIPQFFRTCCQKYSNLPALVVKNQTFDTSQIQENWTIISYREYEINVKKAALALLHLNVKPRTSVGILASNCPEWFYIHLGAIQINAISTGIYTTNSSDTIHHVLHTSEASVVIVEDSQQFEKIQNIKEKLPNLQAIVQLRGPYGFSKSEKTKGYYRWIDLMQMEWNTDLNEELHLRDLALAPNDCALLIFTSGTVGMPKGVMVSHDAILYTAQAVSKSLPNLCQGNETIISYLPLNHIAGQFFDIFMAMLNGTKVFFADRNALKGTLGQTMIEMKPTRMLGVPRVYEKLQEKLMSMEANYWTVFKKLMGWAREVTLEYHLNPGKRKSLSYLKYCIASLWVSRCRKNLGLDKLKSCFIGGAPVPKELKLFFMSLDQPLTVCYGLSETCGIVVYNFDYNDLEAVGKPIGDIEVRINKDTGNGKGEVLMRGRMNFMGYLKEPQKTKETLTGDGWLLTGDMGHLNLEGNLYINGRIKELIITSGGENMPPNYIEDLIKKELPCLSNVVAIGDRRKYVTALLTFKTFIDPETGYPLDILLPEAVDWLSSIGQHYTHLSHMLHIQLPDDLQNFDPNTVQIKLDDPIYRALEAGIKRANEKAISNAQKIQYFSVLPHDFSVPTGELGPTLKSRRSFIHEKYTQFIEEMYQRGENI
ncbi:long-chain-fatty-acid--CoA ligase heimdall-like [Haematobia irritans]|uniref:long-chain-fatty-acid--CoA ligase heimdall-like n=1 Tax=Haematobia irritans TaxID=7368 RepID=UPI003F504308